MPARHPTTPSLVYFKCMPSIRATYMVSIVASKLFVCVCTSLVGGCRAPHHSNVGRVFQVYAVNKSHLQGIDCCIQAIRVCLHKFSGRLPCTSIFQAVVRWREPRDTSSPVALMTIAALASPRSWLLSLLSGGVRREIDVKRETRYFIKHRERG